MSDTTGFRVGNKVRVTHASTVNHIPIGTTGTVVSLSPDIVVDLDPPWGKRIFRGGEDLEGINDA